MKRNQPHSFLDLLARVFEQKPEQAKKVQALKEQPAFHDWVKAYRANIKKKLDAS